MSEPTMENLIQRLDRLERENRWFRRCGSLTLVGIFAVMMMGQTGKANVQNIVQAKRIEAEELRLKDPNGKVRGVLRSGKDGIDLVFWDNEQKPGLQLSVSDTPILRLFDHGKSTAVLGNSLLMLNGQDGKAYAKLMLNEHGQALALRDKNEKLNAFFGIVEEGTSLSFWDDDAKLRLILGISALVNKQTGTAEKRTESSLVFLDKDGKIIRTLP